MEPECTQAQIINSTITPVTFRRTLMPWLQILGNYHGRFQEEFPELDSQVFQQQIVVDASPFAVVDLMLYDA